MLKKFLIMLLLTILFMFGLAQIALADETESAFRYGIVVDVEADSVVIFTQDGFSITYGYVEEIDYAYRMWGKDIGQLVKYTLSYGEIDNIEIIKEGFFHQVYVGDVYPTWEASEILIRSNAYLTDLTGKSLTLAYNAIIFEVDSVDGKVNPHLITRSSLLSSGNFTSDTLSLNDSVYVNYAVYDLNSDGAIKALAYTQDYSNVYHYGVVKAYGFKCEDYDLAITLTGNDSVYALDVSSVPSRSDSFIVYILSGDKLKILHSFGNDTDLAGYTQMVTGINNGLITVTNGWEAVDYKTASGKLTFEQLLWQGVELPESKQLAYIMTDTNTIVYIIHSSTGEYCEGSLADISRNSRIYVPIVDKDGYADCVLVDEYSRLGNVYGITIDKAYLTLEKNAAEQLNASVWPIDVANKNINWFSSNPDIVMVDTLGNVTALGDGVAVVTEPFPKKWTEKFVKKRNKNNIKKSKDKYEIGSFLSKAFGESQSKAECGRILL